MSESYYGLQIAVLAVGNRWKWQVTLPMGGTVTSNRDYSTSEQAFYQSKTWINSEGVFSALNVWLSELCRRGEIQRREYGQLMQSVLQVTKHR